MMTVVQEHYVELTLDGSIDPLPLDRATHHRVIARRPIVWRPEHTPYCTDAKSALIVPAPWTDDLHPISFLLAAIHIALSTDDGILLIVGLVAPGEDAKLGMARADAARCILEGDVDTWVDLATNHGSIADVKAYLQYLNVMHGWDCPIEIIDRSVETDVERAVSSFQDEYNREFKQSIEVDGVCGKQTLAAIFDVIRWEWNKWLEKHALTQEHVDAIDVLYADGAALEGTLDAVASLEGRPGIETMVASRSVFGNADPTAVMIYESTVVRFQTFDVPVEPWAWAKGPYTIVTDLVPGEPTASEKYTMRSMDGEYEQTLSIEDDAVDAGVLELRFVALPCDKSYELSVTVLGSETYVLFSDVPYNQLHRLAVEGHVGANV